MVKKLTRGNSDTSKRDWNQWFSTEYRAQLPGTELGSLRYLNDDPTDVTNTARGSTYEEETNTHTYRQARRDCILAKQHLAWTYL